MTEKEVHEENPPPPRGNEWEVVSLTSSAYAASPGPYNVDARKNDAYYGAETSRDFYISDHFVFPPSEHENLPIDEPLEQGKDGEEEESMLQGQDLSDKLRNSQFHDETALDSSKHLESFGSVSAMYEHGVNEYGVGDLDLNSDTATNPVKHDKDANQNLPCEAWWRRRAVSIYSSTREANPIWSLFFAAAVTGLVVLGQRWQHERWQILQLKWQSSISSEKLSRVLEPLSRLKDVIVRSNPQASLVRSGASSEI